MPIGAVEIPNSSEDILSVWSWHFATSRDNELLPFQEPVSGQKPASRIMQAPTQIRERDTEIRLQGTLPRQQVPRHHHRAT